MPPTLPPRPPHYWNDLLVAYLHDPPDKPLDIRGHESRARRYAEIAVGRELSAKEASTGASKWADIRASEIERLPLPNAGEKYHRAIGPDQGKLTVSHPLWSGGEAAHRIIHSRSGDEKDVQEALHACVDVLRNPQARYLSLWRLLPDKLAHIDGAFQHLPAETRVPDHTIWQHLDTTAGLYTAYEGNDQLALLSLTIGPVQSFIAAARSVRDLWSGSMILSWLAFQGMQPILEQLGPTALVFPQLRGNPMMDLWLREAFPELEDRVLQPSAAQRKSPCLPNRFVAIVPASEALALAEACQQAVKAGWREIARAVHQHLHPTLKTFDPHWDSRWQQQVDHYFEVFTQTLAWVNHQDDSLARLYGGESFESVFKEAGALRTLERKMPEADRPGYRQDSVGRWQARVELLGRLLETRRIGLQIEALDTLFFRDGRPFGANSRGESGLPTPQTLAGTLRTWLLRSLGCDFELLAASLRAEDATWAKALAEQELDAVAEVRSHGPWLAQLSDDGPMPLLSVPQALRQIKKGTGFKRLYPKRELADWQAPLPGMLPLWLPERVNIEGLSGFVTLAGMRTFLQGAVPEPQQIYAPGQLYGAEQRTGIGINPEQQSVEEGLIYTVNLLRLQPGIGFYAECEIPEALLGLVPDQPWTLPFGGEGRRAMVTRIAPIPWPKAPPVKPQQLRTVVLTTPAWVDSPDALKAWQPKAAALAPWQGISGWDLAQGGPKPLRWTLPAGSTLYFENDVPTPAFCPPEAQPIGWGNYLEGVSDYV